MVPWSIMAIETNFSVIGQPNSSKGVTPIVKLDVEMVYEDCVPLCGYRLPDNSHVDAMTPIVPWTSDAIPAIANLKFRWRSRVPNLSAWHRDINQVPPPCSA